MHCRYKITISRYFEQKITICINTRLTFALSTSDAYSNTSSVAVRTFLSQLIASPTQLPQNSPVYFPHHQCRRFKLQNKEKHTNVLLINLQLLYTLGIKELILTTRWNLNALVVFMYKITYRNSGTQHFTSYRYF